MEDYFAGAMIEDDEEEKLRKKKTSAFEDAVIGTGRTNVPLEVMAANPAMVGARIAQSLPDEAIGAVKGIGSMLAHPVDTLKGAGEAVGSLLEKGGRKFEEFYTGEDIPADKNKEYLANEIIGATKRDYGSLEAAANTMMNKPLQFGTDIAGVGGLLPKVGRTMQALNPLTGAGRGLQAGIGSSGVANKMYRGAAGIEPSSLQRGEALAESGLKNKVPVSRKGLDTIIKTKEAIGNKIQEIIDGGDINGRIDMPIPTRPVMKYLDALIEESRFVDDLESVNTFKALRANFNEQFGDKANFFPDELQKWKVNTYDKVYQADASLDPLVKQGAKAKGQRMMGKGAKEELEKRFPDIAPENVKFAEYAKLKPYVKNRIDALAEQNMHAPFLAIYRKTLANPAFTSRIAIAFDAIANNDMGKLESMFNTHEIRTALALMGRNREFLDEQTEYE